LSVRKPTKRSLTYWEKILRKEGLDMSQGLNPQHESHVGSLNDLAVIEEIKFAESAGCGGGRRVKPKGHGPDQ